jgi:predicted transcriptional regulator
VTLTTPQLCLLRSLKARGCETSLMTWARSRAACSEQEQHALEAAGLIAHSKAANRYTLTPAGRKALRDVPKSRYF